MISQQMIETFQKKILVWFAVNKRDLPWRQTRDPYRIFISEVMSQQTQLSRVVPKYEAWIEKFPTVQSLAAAKVSDVLGYWSGLGYNRRALNLKKTAEIITEKYGGKFPQEEKELLSLPGIGQYTARAVLCFAYNQQIAVLDTNIRKVILTQFLYSEKSDDKEFQSFKISDNQKIDDKILFEIATKLLPAGKAYEWNQALMDYAASVLKKEKIPIPKQTKFHGSRRYYRGQILKQLLQKKKIAISDLGILIKKNFTEEDKEWLKKILDELAAEGFIIYRKQMVVLKS